MSVDIKPDSTVCKALGSIPLPDYFRTLAVRTESRSIRPLISQYVVAVIDGLTDGSDLPQQDTAMMTHTTPAAVKHPVTSKTGLHSHTCSLAGPSPFTLG